MFEMFEMFEMAEMAETAEVSEVSGRAGSAESAALTGPAGLIELAARTEPAESAKPAAQTEVAALSELSVGAISIASRRNPDYRPTTTLAESADLMQLVQATADVTGIPIDQLVMLAAPGDEDDVSALALAALGPPADEQPLFLVRSGPVPDAYSAVLARLVHDAGWSGSDVGITHLDELGGTMVFDLLTWALPEQTGATALICDEPLFADALAGPAPIAVVGLRVWRGSGPLRVLGFGEGAPGVGAGPVINPDTGTDTDTGSYTGTGTGAVAGHRFTGSRPCDGWLALHAALAAGRIVDGDLIFLHTRGPLREGWLSLEAVDVAALRLADADAETVARDLAAADLAKSSLAEAPPIDASPTDTDLADRNPTNAETAEPKLADTTLAETALSSTMSTGHDLTGHNQTNTETAEPELADTALAETALSSTASTGPDLTDRNPIEPDPANRDLVGAALPGSGLATKERAR